MSFGCAARAVLQNGLQHNGEQGIISRYFSGHNKELVHLQADTGEC